MGRNWLLKRYKGQGRRMKDDVSVFDLDIWVYAAAVSLAGTWEGPGLVGKGMGEM